jgi:hypothetical protein
MFKKNEKMLIHLMPDNGRLAYWAEYTDYLEIKTCEDGSFQLTWEQTSMHGKEIRTERVLRFQVLDTYSTKDDCANALDSLNRRLSVEYPDSPQDAKQDSVS